jgi:hypothetical protein
MAERGVGGPDEQQPGNPGALKNLLKQVKKDGASNALREEMLRILDDALHAAENDEHMQRLHEARQVWQDDICEFRRRAGCEVEVEVVVGEGCSDPDPEQDALTDDADEISSVDDIDDDAEMSDDRDDERSVLVSWNPRELYEFLEPLTRHVREMLPKDWAGLYVEHTHQYYGSDVTELDLTDQDTIEYAQSLERALRFVVGDLDRVRHKMTEFYKSLMASRGDCEPDGDTEDEVA